VRDLRRLEPIDNVTSKDLDQIEVAEAMADGGIRAWHRRRRRAGAKGRRSTRTRPRTRRRPHTGISVFLMLPDALSTDRTSLVEAGERLVVVTELEIGPDGAVRRHTYRALAINHAKLDYESIGACSRARPRAREDRRRRRPRGAAVAAGSRRRTAEGLREKTGVPDLTPSR
jgi:exoribonuclease II